MYIYIYTYIHIYIHIYIYIYIYYIYYIYKDMCMYTYIHTYTFACTFIHICKFLHVNIYIFISVHSKKYHCTVNQIVPQTQLNILILAIFFWLAFFSRNIWCLLLAALIVDKHSNFHFCHESSIKYNSGSYSDTYMHMYICTLVELMLSRQT